MPTKNKQRVGDELRVAREDQGLSLHKVEVATKIRGRYLRAIEASDFANLPNDVYSKGFVRQYATYLGLPATRIVKQYQVERGQQIKPIQQAKPRALDLRLGVTSRWVASLAVLAALALIIGYLIWQFSSLTAAPKLKLESPSKDMVTEASSITVKGVAASGSDVFINDAPLPSDINGSFSTTLALQPGVNEVRVVAKNKLGKQSLITRNVLSKQAQARELPTATFDGVAVLLATRDTAVVTIVADGKKVYEGSLAKGASKLISATGNVVITASNPDSISAKLTNSVVAAYDFGSLSTNGTTRTVEFTKTTQVSQ